MITFKDFEGIVSWGLGIVLLLTLLGFFPLLALLGIGVMWLLTLWRSSQ